MIYIKRLSIGDKLFLACNYFILAIILMIVLVPLLFILASSVSSPDEVIRGNVWLWPVGFNIESYINVIKHEFVMLGYRNSIFYTVAGTVINIVLTICAAYPVSRQDLKGRNFVMTMMMITMFFSGGLIPSFLNIRNLGMMNTVWALLLPSALSVYNVIVMKTFFQNTVPSEICDAATIDGCSNIKTLIYIMLPLSKAVISVLVLRYAVGHWNSYFSALLYLRDRNLFPLQIFLREILLLSRQLDPAMSAEELIAHTEQVKQAEVLKYALIVVANIPLLIAYPFIQKYFTHGVMIGSVKG